MWFRVDNRLIHGQIIEAWLPYTGARHLVVANDDMAADAMRQQIAALAVPRRIATHFVAVDGLPARLAACGEATLILFANCRDARRACDRGVVMAVLNMGNLHFAPGKAQLSPHVALSEEDRMDLRLLGQRAVRLDFRCLPGDAARREHAFPF